MTWYDNYFRQVLQSYNPRPACFNWKDRSLRTKQVVRMHNILRRRVSLGQEIRPIERAATTSLPYYVECRKDHRGATLIGDLICDKYYRALTGRIERSIPYLIQFCMIILRLYKVVTRRVRYTKIRRNRDNLYVFSLVLEWRVSDDCAEMDRSMPTWTRSVQKRG